MNFFNKEIKTPHDAQQQLKDAETMLSSIQPVLQKVHSGKAMLMMSKGFDWIEEIFYYLLAIGCIVFIFIMDSIFPFHLLSEIVHKPSFRNAISNSNDIESFNIAVRGLIVLVAVLLLFLGLKKRVIRRSKTMLYESSNELKKAEKYFIEKRDSLSKISTTTQPSVTHNDTPID